MSKSTDFIRSIKSIDYNRYASVSSREKLVVYTISYLRDRDIPLTFNNICIATFKLFPEKFYFSEEFNEYPHIEMLNRTILHLRPLERNYASGSVRTDYQLTKIGEEVANQVAAELNAPAPTKSVAKAVMDEHKKTGVNELNKIKSSDLFKKWLVNDVDDMDVWAFFEVTPYTQTGKIKKFVKENLEFAQDKNEKDIVSLLQYINKKVL